MNDNPDDAITISETPLSPALAAQPQRLCLRIRAVPEGPVLSSREIGPNFWDAWRSTTWRDDFLRGGDVATPFDDLELEIEPEFIDGRGPRCQRITLTFRAPQGKAVRRTLELDAFAQAAIRQAEPLRREQVLGADQNFVYEIVSIPLPDPPPDPGAAWSGVRVKRPGVTIRRSLRLGLLESEGRMSGAVTPESFPVVMTEEAHARAEAAARRGAACAPPVETCAALFGELCFLRETGGVALLIEHALELDDAEQGEFHVRFTAASWARIDAAARALRSRPETSACGFIGQAHGHNFSPGGNGSVCAQCHNQPTCSRHTALASSADNDWSRSVFLPYLPYGCCLIFGRNARGEPVESMYALDDGWLVSRGYLIVPARAVAAAETTT